MTPAMLISGVRRRLLNLHPGLVEVGFRVAFLAILLALLLVASAAGHQLGS